MSTEAQSIKIVPDSVPARCEGSQLWAQVYRLLASNGPGMIKTSSGPEVSDMELLANHQLQLVSMAVRTMALPLGRGALTLGRASWEDAASLPDSVVPTGLGINVLMLRIRRH